MQIFKEVSGNGEDVVIIHGGLANCQDMQIIVDELSSHYKVTNVGLPGSGHCDWDDSINTIHDEADVILSGGLPENAIYIAWSKGGLAMHSIAARYPNRVKRCIGIGTTPKFIASGNWIGFPPPGYEQIVTSMDDSATVDTFVRGAYEAEFELIHPKPDRYYTALKICDSRLDIPRHVMQKLAHLVDISDLREEFKSINCPIDLIIGSNDVNVAKTTFAQIKALNPKVNIHEIEGAQHMPFWTHPQEFNNILRKILQY